jgi:hypothetical protein
MIFEINALLTSIIIISAVYIVDWVMREYQERKSAMKEFKNLIIAIGAKK